MISARLVELIQNHARELTAEVILDLTTNGRTPAFHQVPVRDLDARVFRIYHHLGDWIASANDADVGVEFEQWGRKRFGQGIPLSQIVFAVILLKQHLDRYIRDHAVIDLPRPGIDADTLLAVHLHSAQELLRMVDDFFDRALYYLSRGYEAAAEPPAR
jgi:hypothetical protein